jgi:catechol 2,3-dioxygenase-like lactoylglutathione lyase family enzyme
MRVARPVRDMSASVAFYVTVLGLEPLGGFTGHAGYQGAFVGLPGADWHIEFTRHTSGRPAAGPTDEDLLVLYVPEDRLRAAATRLADAGSGPLRHQNPYWAHAGASVHRDPDGYLVVLCPRSD